MATLKISDISVGDWVEIDHEDFGWQPAQINVCGDLGIGAYFKDIDPEEEYDCTLSQARPIPITAEILEKNGFEKNGEYNEWSTGNWDDIPFIGISLSRQSMRIKNLGTDIFIENKVVYVHQLQRALSLANVDKEITL